MAQCAPIERKENKKSIYPRPITILLGGQLTRVCGVFFDWGMGVLKVASWCWNLLEVVYVEGVLQSIL